MEKKNNKKIHTLDYYIIFCLAFVTVYTIAHTIIFAITGQEATTLTRLVFITLLSEICMCFLIKRFKLHEEAKIVLGKKSETPEEEDLE